MQFVNLAPSYNAYILAESIGKTDELCDPNGGFIEGYNACVRCIADIIGESQTTPQDIVMPEFGQFLNYCSGTNSTTATTSSPAHVITIYITTILNPSGTASPTPTSINEQPYSTNGLDSSPSASLEASDGGQGSKMPELFFWRRRRTRKKNNLGDADADPEPFEKAQLHSDCITKALSETTGGEIHEMEGSWALHAPTAEKPANETPAQELSGEEIRNRNSPNGI
ncbi:unnamed protein product [Clonostachys rosea f. rosea IK726]|uniref:Uncharacterized protein n=1 Tax=Clonostachys rosea f. rosea IK726 TaxID=1349383 RepID=A0ACA9T9D9_BIOOC|nr:unnamed protein product [Clonostachys rosea f. rosea IK726]